LHAHSSSNACCAQHSKTLQFFLLCEIVFLLFDTATRLLLQLLHDDDHSHHKQQYQLQNNKPCVTTVKFSEKTCKQTVKTDSIAKTLLDTSLLSKTAANQLQWSVCCRCCCVCQAELCPELLRSGKQHAQANSMLRQTACSGKQHAQANSMLRQTACSGKHVVGLGGSCNAIHSTHSACRDNTATKGTVSPQCKNIAVMQQMLQLLPQS
jgi:hypothetical protein